MKRLSIIIPVYKVEKYIRSCLESVLAQTIPMEEIEVILVNDGSPDNSIDVINDLIDLYPDSIKVINQKNSGVSVARNTGARNSTGRYILFLDSDDLLQKDALSLMLNVAEEKGADMVRGQYIELYDEQIDTLSEQESCSVDFAIKEYTSHDAYVSLFHPRLGFCWQFLISRELIVNNGLQFLPGVGFMEDFAFVILLFLKSKRFIDTSIDFYIYRKSDSSCTSTMNVQKLQSAISALEVIYKQIPEVHGGVKSKMVLDLCYNVNIIVWFLSHYKSLFPSRHIIVESLKSTLSCLPSYAEGKDKLLLQMLYKLPKLYLPAKYYLARHKY